MAEGRSDRRKDIELWIADTNQETLQPLSDKGPFSPAAPRISPTFPSKHFMSRQSTVPHFSTIPHYSPNLFKCDSHSTLRKPPKPLLSTRSFLSVQGSSSHKSRSTPPSPSYNTHTTTSTLSNSVDELSIGSNRSLVKDNNNTVTIIDHNTYTGDHTTSTSSPSTSTSDPHTFTIDSGTLASDPCTSTSDPITTTDVHGASTSAHGTSTNVQDIVLSEQVLTILSEYIGGAKLSLLTTQLGLSHTDYHNAITNFRLPDTQALYILRLWYTMENRSLLELVNALKSVGLVDVALRLQNGQLKTSRNKKFTDSSNNSSKSGRLSSSSSSSPRPYRSLAQCRGFSVQGEDGLRTVVIKRTGFGEDKEQ